MMLMSNTDQSRSTADGGLGTKATDVLSVADICDRYPGQWILLRVTEEDEDSWPTAGRILIRAPRQQDVLDELEKQPAAARTPPGERAGPICLFCAYPDIVAGPEYEALLAELVPDLSAFTR